jgi:translation initiation factor eIF-2B subunit alpha
MAIVAKALKKPFYVAVESYKFARMYPFTQRDVYDLCSPVEHTTTSGNVPGLVGSHQSRQYSTHTHTPNTSDISTKLEDAKIMYDDTLVDFTPAEYITLLFTDLGVLTPAAVSDELIRLYQ